MTPHYGDIFAGILVGGHGTRLGGVDKARLPMPNGETLLQRLVRDVTPWVHSVVLATRPEQTFPEIAAPTVCDRYPAAGPMAGLQALLAAAPVPWCWLIAVDMPHLTGAFLRPLAAARRAAAPIVMPHTPRGPEPCAALYHRDSLPAIEAPLEADRRALTGLLHDVASVRVDVSVARLANVNRAADLVELSAP